MTRSGRMVTIDVRGFAAAIAGSVVVLLIVATVVTTALVSILNELDESQGADYRICERQNQARAELYLEAAIDPPTNIMTLRQRLYLFDCRPNLRSEPARAMENEEAMVYVRRYARRELDPTP